MLLKTEIQGLSDEELLKMYVSKKDNVLLGELLGRYIRFVFLICMKYVRDEELAKDMSMQIFEKVSNDILKFEIHNFKSWLHVVTKNTCLMHLRSEKSYHIKRISEENYIEKNMENDALLHHEYDLEKELRLEQLEKAINLLEDGQKHCVSLFYIKEKSYKEVAEITGFSVNQVKSHIQNGKRNLKTILINSGEFMLLIFAFLYFQK